jgi:hypothetical protein
MRTGDGAKQILVGQRATKQILICQREREEESGDEKLEIGMQK